MTKLEVNTLACLLEILRGNWGSCGLSHLPKMNNCYEQKTAQPKEKYEKDGEGKSGVGQGPGRSMGSKK